MKLIAASVLATTVSAQYLPYSAVVPSFASPVTVAPAVRAPYYAPYAPMVSAPGIRRAPITTPAPAPMVSAPVIRRAPITMPAPAPVVAEEEEEEIEAGPSVEDSFRDWNVVHKDYQYADAYGDAYNIISTYTYGPNSRTSLKTQEDRAELGALNYAKSYMIAADNYYDQLHHAKLTGADAATIRGLEQGAQSSALWAYQGILDWKGQKPKTASLMSAAAYGIGLQAAEDALDGSYGSQLGYDSALQWYLGATFGYMDKAQASTDILAIAVMTDAEIAELALFEAEDAYFANPTYANARALEIAELEYDSAMAGYYAGLASINSGLGGALDGNFGSLMAMQQYALAREVAGYALEDATSEFVETHGVNPYSYLGGYY